MLSSNLSISEVTENLDVLSIVKAKYKNQDFLGALTEYTYTQIIHLNPRHALAYCCRGVTYYRLGDPQNDKIDYDLAIEIDPLLDTAYYRRGFLAYIAKNYLAAIDDYNRAIELNPDFALAYSTRGYVYRDLYGEQEAAIDWRFAAKLFKEQGNLAKHQNMLRLVSRMSDLSSWASGMLC
jgi:tetratricopeptide (TPR) repeat protein